MDLSELEMRPETAEHATDDSNRRVLPADCQPIPQADPDG
jgi:hypothetical protein